MEKLPSGVPGFDELVQGGLPRGRATLISGRSGTGKTVTALQCACELARTGDRALFVSVEESAADLIGLGEELGFGTRALIAARALTVLDLVPSFGGDVAVSGDFDLLGLAMRLSKHAEDAGAKVVVVDSLTALFAPVPVAPSRHLLSQLVTALLKTGSTLVLTSETPADYGVGASTALEDFVCDLVVCLRNVIDGKRRRRSIEVQKYRRSAHLKGEYPCAITGEGMRVFPLDAEASRDVGSGTERLTSGVPGLDEMTGGGWLRDAIVLVRGPTGSGKTIMSGMYACAGAARGERVFYYGFEESQPLLLRNFDLLGIPVRQYVESGNLKIVARFPEATSPEDMVIEMRTVLEEYEPSLIVLDSISAIEHVTSYESFRQFIVGITSALRQHGRSAVLTQSVAEQASPDTAAPYLSTLADAILLVGYELTPESMNRYIRVLKMRGSRHSHVPHRLAIGHGGVVVDAVDPAANR